MLNALERWGARFAQVRPWMQRILLALLAAALFLPALASMPVTDRDEARFVQASRQMVESGDLIDIRFQDVARHKKPVGIYWLQSLAAVTHGSGPEAPMWVWRMPSYVAAIAAVVLVAVVGAPLIGAPAAALAAALFAATLVLGGEARIAKTDAVLLALILAAQAVLARLYARAALDAPPVRRGLIFAFWGCVGAAVLVKGPIAPMVLGLTVLAVSLARRELRWLAPLRDPWAIALALALVLPWLVAISWVSGGEFWHASVGQDMLAKVAAGQEGKGAPPGSYLLALWLTFWPGSVLLALMLPRLWRLRRDPAALFLVGWLVPSWIVFELVATKLVHYVLPVYPALALLVLLAWVRRGGGPQWRGARWLVAPLLAIGPALPAAAAWFGVTAGAVHATAPALLGGAVSLGLTVMLWRALGRDMRFAPIILLALIGGVSLGASFATLARVPYLWPSEAAMQLARTKLTPDCTRPRLIAIGYNEPSLVVLAGRDTLFASAQAALAALAADPCAVLLVEARAAAALEAASPSPDPNLVPVGQIEGFSLGGGRSVRLSLYRGGGRS